MSEKGLLLIGKSSCGAEIRISALLDFFGVPWDRSTLSEALSPKNAPAANRWFCSPEAMLAWVDRSRSEAGTLSAWRERVHSVFIVGSGDPVKLRDLVSVLSGDPNALITESRGCEPEVSVSGDLPAVCGVMSGVKSKLAFQNVLRTAAFDRSKCQYTPIIQHQDRAAFFRIDFHGVPVFISAAEELVDLNAELSTRNFDVRERFLAAVPIVLYIRWAFPHTAWRPPKETSACLIIDDPLLKTRYGFLDYRNLLALMEARNFTTNIAFIPWNWRRDDPGVVGLFRSHQDRYSISVHGCDHTAAEFGTADVDRLRTKAARAVDRMERHRRRTGLDHDPIMVFPQGVFSRAAVKALKGSGFRAIVNTDVTGADTGPESITVRDVWETAVLNYDGYPLFTRRYPSQGEENFAFDAILGKPCLVVIHHDFLRNGGVHLEDFIVRLAALNWCLTWRSLGDALRRSFLQRRIGPASFEIRMYGTDLVIENPSEQPAVYIVRKSEPDPRSVEAISLNSRALPWKEFPAGILFECQLRPGEAGYVAIGYRADPPLDSRRADSLKYRMASAARRYACEIRDNFVVPREHQLRSYAERLRRHLGN